jgi:hypothetical protein
MDPGLDKTGLLDSIEIVLCANRAWGERMDKITWIKDLVRAEQEMEESGMIDFNAGFDPQKLLAEESLHFLNDLKVSFVDTVTTFNQLKSSPLGRIKVYGISNTEADFMLFRNGFKLIFALKKPGLISIRFLYVGATFVPGAPVSDKEVDPSEDQIVAKWGPFGDLVWTYNDQSLKIDFLVRYYMSRFIKESAK